MVQDDKNRIRKSNIKNRKTLRQGNTILAYFLDINYVFNYYVYFHALVRLVRFIVSH
jgi:hypothetical protein